MTIRLADRASVRWKADSDFGGISDASLVPPSSYFDVGATALPVEMLEVIEGEPEMRERNEVRAKRGRRRNYRIGPRVSGDKVVRRTATFTAQMVVRGIGTGTADDHPLVKLLGALLEDGGDPDPSWTTDTVEAYHDPAPAGHDADVNHFHPETVARFAEGDLITSEVDGRVYPLYVVGVDDTADAEYVQVLGAPRHLTAGDIIRPVRTWRVGDPGARDAGNIRFDKEGYAAEFFGVRIQSVSFTVAPSGDASVLALEFNFDARFMRYDHTNASIATPVSPGAGPELQFSGGTAYIGAALPAESVAGPYAVDSAGTLNIAELEVTIEAELAEAPDQITVLAGRNVIRDVMMDARVQLSQPQTGFDADLEGDVDRWFSFAIGSPGQGGAFVGFIPIGLCNADRAARGENDEVLVQDLRIQDGIPRGTETPASSTSPFLIGLVL